MKCEVCGREAVLSKSLPLCPDCIREHVDELSPRIRTIHARTRGAYGLPEQIPDDPDGVTCSLCVNGCRIGRDKTGYCGVRKNCDGTIKGPDKTYGYCDWYHDPLPTNCVADWVCAGSSHHGFTNCAVFYQACTFNCLFCQNWHFRDRKAKTTTEELAHAVNPTTGCICFFGGDPTPCALHTIQVSREVQQKRRKVRICWETNGSVASQYMDMWIDIALKTNGCIKIDLKTFSEPLNIALCGSSNKNTKENIQRIARSMKKRQKPPLLVVIPGYIDDYELMHMAEFLSSVDRSIPWSFLGFYPHFHFSDMPRTQQKQAESALRIARAHGMENTHVGNVHLFV
jgi:pyruvate formate lyase activating enzyme